MFGLFSSSETAVSETVCVEVEGVRCVLVSPRGQEICEIERNTVVRIVERKDSNEKTMFIQTKKFSAQLLPEVPVLQAAEDLFIFSNLTKLVVPPVHVHEVDDEQSFCVAIFLPSDIDSELMEKFVYALNLASNLCILNESEDGNEEVVSQRPLIEGPDNNLHLAVVKRDWDDVWSERIAYSSGKVASTIGTCAEYGSTLIKKAGSSVRSKLKPREKDVEVGTTTKAILHGTERTTAAITTTLSWVVNGVWSVAEGTMRVVGSWVLARFPSSNNNVSKKWAKVLQSGGVGALLVLDSLVQASDTLMDSAATETTETVRHKYGQDAAYCVEKSAKTFKNAKAMSRFTKQFAYKTVVKKGAKTVATVVMTLDNDGNEKGSTVTAVEENAFVEEEEEDDNEEDSIVHKQHLE
eukprot:m.239949 g.239949  ORF g.239949 m.239949 type:complete len:409 (-) comp14319_c0_seq1:157-1383(-)